MLQLILGPATSGKTTALFDALRQRTAAQIPGAIFIVPEQYSHAAERELVAAAGPSVSLYAEVLSFTRLAGRVADELGGKHGVPLDAGGRMLTMRMALRAVAEELTLYGNMGRRPEFLQGLLDTIDELKQCGLDPAALLDAAPWTEGALGDKLRDLAFLLGAYDNLSGKRDPRDTLTRLADSIGDSVVTTFSIFVDAFSDFTAVEGRILKRLLQAGADVTVALTCHGLHDDSPLFAPAVETANRLKRWAEDVGQKVTVTELPPGTTRPAELQAVAQYLFADKLPDVPVTDPDPTVELYTAATSAQECELAAARVRKLVMDEGYRYRDIAVTARGFDSYETVTEHVFAQYDIPVHMARKSSILEKPILLLLTSALDILDGGWRFEAVFRYLRTGLAGISQREVDVLEGYVRQWNLQGSAWTKQADWVENPAGYQAAFGAKERAELDTINALRHRISAPLLALSATGQKATIAAEQATALYDFLDAIGLPQTLTEKAARFRDSGRETLAAEYSQIWDILMDALEQAHAILSDTPMEQSEFAALMRLTLGQYQVGSIPQTIDRVQLGDLDRTRRRDLKCLIVLGATDTRLPTPGGSQGILTDLERDRLRELGLTLSDSAEMGIYREQALIYHAFSAPKEKLIVSCPESEGKDPCRPSAVFVRLGHIVGRDAMPMSALGDAALQNAPAPAFDLALRAALCGQAGPTAEDAAAYFAGDSRLQALTSLAIGRNEELSEPINRQLYGDTLRLSASKVETFGSCAFRYFMQYGLGAKGRKKADLDAPMAGEFMHFILENVTREIQDRGGFHTEAADDWSTLTAQFIAEYIDTYIGNMDTKTQRFRYLFNRLVRETDQVVADMVEELRRSDFTPLHFELAFGGEGAALPPVSLSADGVDLTLQGKVDRVDGWLHDGKIYLRVVDYKTGRQKFSLSDIWYGVGVQMLLYLFAITRLGGELYGDMPLVPGGVLYAAARDILVQADKNTPPEEIEKARRKELVRSGLILRDPALIEAMERGEKHQFIPVKISKKTGDYEGDALVTAEELGRLGRHIDRTLLALAKEMRAGQVAPSPHMGSGSSPCDYCDYRGACHHDPAKDGVRYLERLSKSEVLERLMTGDV
ncbi:MAG: PD-(D/E)XK nuclease family protein [Oscillospiraceae bacterium]|nr:PD-(D/E)XK nuclease family protein [Oscillospiraceae bacterium]